MVALLYAATALLLLWLTDRFITPISRGAALALLILPLCFTGRAVLTDRVYAPVEMPYLTQPLSDHRAQFAIGPPHNLALADVAFQMMPWRESLRRSLADREWPLWNRFMMCGDLLASSAQPSVFNPFTLIACLLPTALSFTFTAAITFFLAGLGAFLFARLLGCSPGASIVAAVGWMFSAAIALLVLFPLGFAWALLPAVLAAVRRTVTACNASSIAFLTAALTLEIVAGHPETVLHVTFVGAVYGLFELGHAPSRVRAVGAAIVAGALSLLLTAIFLLPFLEAVRTTQEYWIRSAMYAPGPLRIRPGSVTAAALGDLFPFARTQFHQPSLVRAEGGSILLALAIAAIVCIRSREKVFFAALLLFGILAGIQAWPVAQLLHRLPLFDATLNDRFALLVPFALSILAAFAVDGATRVPIVVSTGIVLLGIGGAAFYFAARGPIDNAAVIAEVAPLAAAAVVWIVVPNKSLAVPLLIGALLAQQVLANGSLVPVHDRRAAYPPLHLFEPLANISEPFRIVGQGPALLTNTATMYGLEDPHGSTALTFRPFAETYPLWITQAYGQFDQVRDLARPILSMLNVRFALTSIWDPIPRGWHQVVVDRATRLIENEKVLSRAFVPRRVRFGDSPAQEIEEMGRLADFADLAWIDVPERPHERVNGPGEVKTERRKLGVRLDAVMQQPGFVVISQTAWPGWRTYVDGSRVKTLRANHAFLAVYLPAGRHRVRLEYLPQTFVIGRNISGATLLLIAGFAGGWWFRIRRRTTAAPGSP